MSEDLTSIFVSPIQGSPPQTNATKVPGDSSDQSGDFMPEPVLIRLSSGYMPGPHHHSSDQKKKKNRKGGERHNTEVLARREGVVRQTWSESNKQISSHIGPSNKSACKDQVQAAEAVLRLTLFACVSIIKPCRIWVYGVMIRDRVWLEFGTSDMMFLPFHEATRENNTKTRWWAELIYVWLSALWTHSDVSHRKLHESKRFCSNRGGSKLEHQSVLAAVICEGIQYLVRVFTHL